MTENSGGRAAPIVGMIVAFLMIANQVAGKATRDALFLSNFSVTSLPLMVMAAAGVSILAVLGFSRLMQRLGPAGLIPRSFGLSGLLLFLNWALTFYNVSLAAILVYLQLAVFGSILISGFWSLINERFDPRRGKKLVSRIATGAALGGLAGGLLADRVASDLSVSTILLFLGAIHILCFLILRQLNSKESPGPVITEEEESGSLTSSFKLLSDRSYLRQLAALVLLSTVGATLLDYVFKVMATDNFGDPEGLLRFFAIYYSVIGVGTVVLQGSVSRFSLEKLGLVRTVSVLPAAITVGGLASFFFPVLGTLVAARGSEAVLQSSLYRSAYELFYTPIPTKEKRSTKTIIDVGFDRLGDAVGAGGVRAILFLAPAFATSVMLLAAVGTGILGLFVARKLHGGYVQALENSLRNRAIELELSDVEDRVTRETVMSTMAEADIKEIERHVAAKVESSTDDQKTGGKSDVRDQGSFEKDEVLREIASLRSGSEEVIRKVLGKKPDLLSVPHLIRLLAWDKIAPEVIRTLRKVSDKIIGQLIDALVSAETDFSIRRRIPRAMVSEAGQRAVDGLMLGMQDRRFEVRFQCGRALARISAHADLWIPKDEIYELILKEVDVDRSVWESHRLLDKFDDDKESSHFIDEFVKDRANRSLEHVFTLLSTVLPREPLSIAFRGLHTDDSSLKGTSLEYLESVLPETVRDSLWPFLEDKSREKGNSRSREEILEALLKSNQSIQISLKELKEKRQGEGS